jgi:predicted transcriptional regulator
MSGSESSYRDRIYIVKDLILKLIEHNELNQTTLLSFCGLNLKKHKSILDDLEANEFISKTELPYGKRRMVVYKPTRKGIEFCTNILEPYERVFPRRKIFNYYAPKIMRQEDKSREQQFENKEQSNIFAKREE